MSRLTAMIPLVIAAFAMSGCGTIGNLQDRDKIYGGARLDGKEALRACKDLLHRPEVPDYTLQQDTAILVYATVDTPISMLADTLTLPITVPKTIYHWFKGDPSADGQPNQTEVVSQSALPTPKEPPLLPVEARASSDR